MQLRALCNFNLPDVITTGGANDGGGVSPVTSRGAVEYNNAVGARLAALAVA